MNIFKAVHRLSAFEHHVCFEKMPKFGRNVPLKTVLDYTLRQVPLVPLVPLVPRG